MPLTSQQLAAMGEQAGKGLGSLIVVRGLRQRKKEEALERTIGRYQELGKDYEAAFGEWATGEDGKPLAEADRGTKPPTLVGYEQELDRAGVDLWQPFTASSLQDRLDSPAQIVPTPKWDALFTDKTRIDQLLTEDDVAAMDTREDTARRAGETIKRHQEEEELSRTRARRLRAEKALEGQRSAAFADVKAGAKAYETAYGAATAELKTAKLGERRAEYDLQGTIWRTRLREDLDEGSTPNVSVGKALDRAVTARKAMATTTREAVGHALHPMLSASTSDLEPVSAGVGRFTSPLAAILSASSEAAEKALEGAPTGPVANISNAAIGLFAEGKTPAQIANTYGNVLDHEIADKEKSFADLRPTDQRGPIGERINKDIGDLKELRSKWQERGTGKRKKLIGDLTTIQTHVTEAVAARLSLAGATKKNQIWADHLEGTVPESETDAEKKKREATVAALKSHIPADGSMTDAQVQAIIDQAQQERIPLNLEFTKAQRQEFREAAIAMLAEGGVHRVSGDRMVELWRDSKSLRGEETYGRSQREVLRGDPYLRAPVDSWRRMFPNMLWDEQPPAGAEAGASMEGVSSIFEFPDVEPPEPWEWEEVYDGKSE